MSLETYSDLKTSIANWLKRGDLTSVIPDFIRLGEIKLERDLLNKEKFKNRPRDMEDTTTSTTSSGIASYPSGYKGTLSFKVTSGETEYNLDYIPPAGVDDVSGVGYTLTEDGLQLIGLGDTDYDYTWRFITSFTALSDSNTTNWLLAAAPDLYLYAALTESAPYTKDDERITIWAGKYNLSLADYAALVMTDRQSEGALRMRSNRVA